MHTGICSITFRKKTPSEIIALTSQAGLDGIEWGGDVHAPPSLPSSKLVEIRKSTEEAGLLVSSYGSYYNVLDTKVHPEEFFPVLDAAEALGTRVIRIWSGGGASENASETLFKKEADRTRELCELAKKRGITLAFEFHGGCLTDTVPSTIRLLNVVKKENLKTYYQVYERGEETTPEEELKTIIPYLSNVHCYEWTGAERHLLEEGQGRWERLIDILGQASFKGFILLEFVKDDSPESLLKDAQTLREMVLKYKDEHHQETS